MKERKLIPLIKFAFELDALDPKEFCKIHLPHVPVIGVSLVALLQIKASKYHVIMDYANFLNKPLTLDMFYPNINGEIMSEDHPDFKLYQDKLLFKGFTFDESTFSHTQSISYQGILNIFWRDNNSDKWRLSNGLTIIDSLTKLGLTYNK